MFDLWRGFEWLKKQFTRRDVLLILLLTASYFISRLINLDKFPIFTDEGIYIRWAKVAWHDATWRFISLTDGRQPLQTWATIPFLKLFPSNPLFAGRLFSVSSGFVALIGIFVLLYYIFGKKAAFWGSFFYIFTPYFLFYDRMALVDGTVNAGFIWVFFLILLLANSVTIAAALSLGLVSGISLLAKSSVRLFLGMGIFAPILFWQNKISPFLKKAINYYALFAVASVLALIIYNVQRLSPFFHFVSGKNYTFVLRFSEFLQSPFQVFFSNLTTIPEYVFWESAFILPILGVLGLILIFKKDRRLFFYFILWFLLPFLVIAFFGRVVYPRYLNFFATLFLVLAAYFISQAKNRMVVVVSCLLLLASCLYFDYTIVFAQTKIPFPSVDRGQYIEGISSGYGVREIINFARQKTQEKPVILLAEGNFGVVGDMLDASLGPNEQISIRGYWPLDKKTLLENQKDLLNNYVYIVFSHRTKFPSDWPMRLVQKFAKPGNQSAFYLFELIR